ncbi:PfkB family carbohydrate kinase [Sutterella sp.]|uniref:PfkB family carbohydrate kinase n=1 Tax=Sutterella sp. TaxID=1981025 RepID=UPI003FD783AB
MRGICELIDALIAQERLLVVGSAFVDVIVHVPRLPLSGEDVEGSSRQQVVGGCAFNVADVVAKLELPFETLIPIGEGMIAERVRESFRMRAMATREYHDLGDNGWCLSFVEPSGERTFVSMSGIEKCFRPEWLDAVAPEAQDLIYLSGYQTDERNADFIAALLERKRPDARILFDPGPCADRIPQAMKEAVLAANAILKVNASEARVLAPAADVETSARTLSLSTGCPVVVTDGARGALVVEGEEMLRVPGFPVHVVDTIGSGDAHAGGMLAGLMCGFPLPEAVLLGNAVASWVTGEEGGASAPNAARLRARHA